MRKGWLLININLIPFCLFWEVKKCHFKNGCTKCVTFFPATQQCQTCCDPPLQKLLSQSKSQTRRALSPPLRSKIRLSGLRPATYNSEVTVASGRQAVSYWFLPGTLFQNIIAASAEGCRAVHPRGAFLCPFLVAIRPALNCNHYKWVSSMANKLFFFFLKSIYRSVSFPQKLHMGKTEMNRGLTGTVAAGGSARPSHPAVAPPHVLFSFCTLGSALGFL